MNGYVGLCLCQVSCNVYAGVMNEVLLKVVLLVCGCFHEVVICGKSMK